MKKIITILLFLISFNTAYSQIEKHTFTIGGSGSYQTGNLKVSNNKDYNVNLDLGFGYFAMKNLMVGLKMDENFYSLTSNGNTNGSNHLYGPWIRVYMKKNNHALFAELSYLIGYSKQSATFYNPYGNPTFSVTGTTLQITPGIGYSYFINNWVALELLYNYSLIETEYASTPYYFSLQSSKQNYEIGSFNIGLRIFFPAPAKEDKK